ncbi:MAG: NADH-quinone oxidoreductase subunit NuoE [Betaproteobacteria bacterium]
MKHLIPEFEKLRTRYPADFKSSLVLPCLRRIQEDRGYVANTDIEELVEYLGVPRIQIEEVLSYYTQFRRKPIGRFHIQVCRNLSCSLLGAERLVDHLTRRLGINVGESTRDGRFTLSTVECIAACGSAPMVIINETHHAAVSPESIDALLDSLDAHA